MTLICRLFFHFTRRQIPSCTNSVRKEFADNVEWKNNHKKVLFQSEISMKCYLSNKFDDVTFFLQQIK